MLPTRDLEKEIESHPANTRSKKGIGQDTRLGLVYSRVGTELDKVNLHKRSESMRPAPSTLNNVVR